MFEIFDFNEEEALGYENMALMLLNVCNATYKVYGLKKSVPHTAIEPFLDQYFTHESRMTLPRLTRWTYRVSEIVEFFGKTGHEMEPPKQHRSIATYDSK